MKVWYAEIGDEEPTAILPDQMNRPAEKFFYVEGSPVDPELYSISWLPDPQTQELIPELVPVILPHVALRILNRAKEARKNYIRAAYSEAERQPVTTPYGVFTGGESSAAAINGAMQLSQAASEAEVKLTDSQNRAGFYTYAQCMEITFIIGMAARAAFFKKQELMCAVDDATSVEEVNSINW